MLNFCVNDILDLALIKQGKFRKNCCTFSMKEAIEDVIIIQQQKADNLQVSIGYEMVGFVDPTGRRPEDTVCTDKLRFKQVLLNFQSNALKFTPRGGRVTIRCSLLRERGRHGSIQTEVIDTGVGISQENQKNLF